MPNGYKSYVHDRGASLEQKSKNNGKANLSRTREAIKMLQMGEPRTGEVDRQVIFATFPLAHEKDSYFFFCFIAFYPKLLYGIHV
jgi:3-phenylpropionate/cinnamic acid dioxygenase small subunit